MIGTRCINERVLLTTNLIFKSELYYLCIVLYVLPYLRGILSSSGVLMSPGQRAGDSAVHHRPSQCSGGAVWEPHIPKQLRSIGRLQCGGHPTTTGGQELALKNAFYQCGEENEAEGVARINVSKQEKKDLLFSDYGLETEQESLIAGEKIILSALKMLVLKDKTKTVTD